jgi:hypothetical protein
VFSCVAFFNYCGGKMPNLPIYFTPAVAIARYLTQPPSVKIVPYSEYTLWCTSRDWVLVFGTVPIIAHLVPNSTWHLRSVRHLGQAPEGEATREAVLAGFGQWAYGRCHSQSVPKDICHERPFLVLSPAGCLGRKG